MKIESENDIPAFQGKNRQERAALRREAAYRDPAIVWISSLGGGLVAPLLYLATCLVQQFRSVPGEVPFIGPYLLLIIPVFMLFRRVFIVPRIRRALAPVEAPPTEPAAHEAAVERSISTRLLIRALLLYPVAILLAVFWGYTHPGVPTEKLMMTMIRSATVVALTLALVWSLRRRRTIGK